MHNAFSILTDDLRQYWWSPEQLGFHMLERTVGEAPKDDHTERVPYSNITYDFDDYYGISSCGERTLAYKFDLVESDARKRQNAEIALRKHLSWRGYRRLQDAQYPDFYFEARAPVFAFDKSVPGVLIVTVTFKAAPAMLPRTNEGLTSDMQRYPDLDGDGHVTAADAALILAAAEHIAAGEPSGLTDAQERLADADLDGVITAADSALVLQYAQQVTAGQLTDSEKSWQDYLRLWRKRKGGIV